MGIDKAFLCRDAAICAENEADYKLAKKYFLLGSLAASESERPELKPMQIGLKADAALASWHGGNRGASIKELAIVLHELKGIDPKGSIKAAYCHATCRHILLWLQQEATGEKRFVANGEEVSIYPGIVSNPQPSTESSKHNLTPIEMAWYMLATVENHSFLDVNILSQLKENLANGPIAEGECILALSKLEKAIMLSNSKLFIVALKQAIAGLTYFESQKNIRAESKEIEFTYCSIPEPTPVQLDNHIQISEQFVLCYVACCAINERWADVDKLVDKMSLNSDIKVRKELVNILKGGNNEGSDSITSIAKLLISHRREHININPTLPIRVFELAYIAVIVGIDCGKSTVISRMVFEWLKQKWMFIWDQQRALLRNPSYHFGNINKALSAKDYSWPENVLCLMKSILPALGIRNEFQVNKMLDDLLKRVLT